MSRTVVNCHPRLADIANHARVIGIVPAVGRKVEGDRQPLLPHREVAPVESVRFLGGGEARVLPDSSTGGPHTSRLSPRA